MSAGLERLLGPKSLASVVRDVPRSAVDGESAGGASLKV